MNELVVHHYYSHSAFDLSDYRNHGRPLEVAIAGAPDWPAFSFQGGDNSVTIPPSTSLQNLYSIHAVVTFKLFRGPISHRYNLMEGHLSFALVVEQDGSLGGAILDSSGNWIGAKSTPNLVSTDGWHTAEMLHDGVGSVELYLDGARVAQAYNAPGPVRSVGIRGIAIGHWAESESVYTLNGYIREVKLYKFDPYKHINGLLDYRCMDRKAIDSVMQMLRQSQITPELLAQKGYEILQFAIEVMFKVCGGDAAATTYFRQSSSAALTAFLRSDQTAYTTALAKLALLAQEHLNQQQMMDIDQQKNNLIARLPLSLDNMQKLLAMLCWDKVKIDPESLASEMKRLYVPPAG